MSAELAARRTAAAAVLGDYTREADGAGTADLALWAARMADMLSHVLAVLDDGDQAAREDAGTITHIPTGATWVTWDQGRQPPWDLIAEAVSRLTGGTVKIRAGSGEDEPDRLYVAVYRDLPELEDE